MDWPSEEPILFGKILFFFQNFKEMLTIKIC